jgi:hypothetical protein
MELGSYFLFLQEQRKDIILIIPPPSFCAAASGAPTRDRHKTAMTLKKVLFKGDWSQSQ